MKTLFLIIGLFMAATITLDMITRYMQYVEMLIRHFLQPAYMVFVDSDLVS